MKRTTVQKNKNKQKQELKSKKMKEQRLVYSGDGSYANIIHINLSRKSIDMSAIKLPVKYRLRDLSTADPLEILFVSRASDLLILTITDIDIDGDLLKIIKLCMPSTVIAHDKKLKNVANRLSKDFGSPKTCEMSMLNVVLNSVELHCPADSSERPYMLVDRFESNNGIIVLEGFMKNGLASDKVIINGRHFGTIVEVVVENEIIPGTRLNHPSPLDEMLFPYTNVENEASDDELDAEEIELESDADSVETEDVEYEVECQPPEVDLISKYADYRGVRNLATCKFHNRAQDIPEHYKDVCFLKNPLQSFNRIKNAETIIPRNKGVMMRISMYEKDLDFSKLGTIVLYNLFDNEGTSTIMNYEFTSNEPLPETIQIYDGVGTYNVQGFVTRNLNCGAFKPDSQLTSGVVSFIAPFLHGNNKTAYGFCGMNGSIIRLYNGKCEDRIFFEETHLVGWPTKICKRHVIVKRMFYNKEQVEYFSSVKLETKRGVTGFIKKPLGMKGMFKAYFPQQVNYGENITMKLYRRKYLPFP